MFAGPAAGSDAALAAVEEGIGIAHLELALQGLIALGDAQWERVRIEEQFAILHVAARRRVGIANHEMSAGVLAGICPHPAEHVQPADVRSVVLVHQADLAEVDRLDARIDVLRAEVIEPHAGLELVHVGNHAVAHAMDPGGIANAVEAEVALRERLIELLQHVLRNRDRFHATGHDLKGGPLKDDVRVRLVQLRRERPAIAKQGVQLAFASPAHQGPADKLGTGVLNETDVVPRIDAAPVARLGEVVMKEFGEGDGARQVVFQHLARDLSVETVIATGGFAGTGCSPAPRAVLDKANAAMANNAR